MRRPIGAGLLSAAMLLLFTPASWGQAFPDKPMHIVVPYAPGGTVDWLARTVGEHLSRRLKQPVIVENKPGGGAVIGMSAVAKSPPDGHTLVVTSNTVAAVRIFNKETDFDAQKSLTPVSLALRDYYFVFANKQVPAKNLQEFVAYAKANPGKLNIATVTNSMQHLDTLRFANLAGANVALVPYNGGAASNRAMLAGEVDANITVLSNFVEHLAGGTIVPLAIAAPARSAMLPNVPTAKESGVDYEAGIWYAFFTAPGTPDRLVNILSKEIAEILKDPAVAEQVKKQGLEAVGSTPEVLAEAVRTEGQRATEAAAKAGL